MLALDQKHHADDKCIERTKSEHSREGAYLDGSSSALMPFTALARRCADIPQLAPTQTIGSEHEATTLAFVRASQSW